jgi:predicted ATPase/DNA-binding CsgD family transcriptional regulator
MIIQGRVLAGLEQPMISSRAISDNLPLQLTSFIGREREMAEVRRLLAMTRLLTLTGVGGCGKTRLAVQVAAMASSDYADGVHFVTLAAITDPGLVIPTIAQAFGVREQGNRPLLDGLHDLLREKQLLLLLDNFEQIISAAPVVVDLLVTVPALKVLVTSRAPLHLSGEHELVVPPLSLPDLPAPLPLERLTHFEAVRLYLERAQAVQSDFALTEANAISIVAICHQLDGLPLAIELAAGRSKLFPPQALLPRLRNRLKVLVGGVQDLPSRQQTLRGTIAWSYDLLERVEQTLFMRLAVFVGGCTIEAAEAVCHPDPGMKRDVLDGVASLVDKSLLKQETQADGQPRLLMLETIREYALECLVASGEAEAVRRQHAIFFLRLAEEAEPKIRGAEYSPWRTRLEVELNNLRAALHWTLESQEAEMGLQLAGALLAFWRVSNQDREGGRWCEQVLAQPGARVRTAARAKALLAAGIMTMFQGDLPQAQRLLEESMSIGREGGTAAKRNLALALAASAYVALLQGNPGAARELAGEGVRLFQEVREVWGAALALNHLGRATLELGDPAAARPLLEESVALFRLAGDRQRLALPLNALGRVALRQGDDASARTYCEEALSVARETGDDLFIAEALALLGTVALHVGNYGQSTALFQQSLALIWTRGYREYIAEDLTGLAAAASLLGQPKRAARLFGAVEALREVSGISMLPLPRADYNQAVEGIRAHLDEATFAAAWEKGRAMPLEQAIEEALEAKDESPTEAKFQQASEEDASSLVLPGTPSSPYPTLSPRRALKQHYGGLTAREREVARLVAQGKSNRAIADELVVGVSTVEAHITHILSKLGFSSRAQIAVWAVDKGLAQGSQDVEVTRQER